MLTKIQEMRDLPLFADMEDLSFKRLMRGAYVQNFPVHADLITEGDSADFLHVMVSGCVELFSEWQGHQTTMSFLGTHATFILAATIKDRPYLMSARTVEKSRIIMIPSDDVRGVFNQDGNFAKSIVTELAGCYRGVIKSAKNMKLRSSTVRIANYLLREQRNADGAGSFFLALEKRRIAALLGMTPENLSRGFSSLKKYGVTVNGDAVLIADSGKLAAFAKPNALIDD